MNKVIVHLPKSKQVYKITGLPDTLEIRYVKGYKFSLEQLKKVLNTGDVIKVNRIYDCRIHFTVLSCRDYLLINTGFCMDIKNLDGWEMEEV